MIRIIIILYIIMSSTIVIAKKYNPYTVKCIFGYKYYVWEKAFRGIPVLDKKGNMIFCKYE